MRGPVRTAFGVIGVFATLLGLLSVGAPSFVADTEPLATLVGTASTVEPRTLFVVGSAAFGLYLVGAAWASPEDRLVGGDCSGADRFERVLAAPPETVTAPDRTLVADDFDAAVERANDGDERAMDQIRERLRRLAVARLERDGWDDGSAAEAVASGEWTDDRTAAAFLSDAGATVPSLRSRLGLWLDPATERERRIRRTVAAIDALPDTGPAGETSQDGADTDHGRTDEEGLHGGGVGG
ncbi:hypothetical protein ACFQMA_20250 [Halosimplex aquaticum]|uniref:DUF4129 domain-containing protein n=1 Tax=Halosimplex aquaticum TaxID=3026162 RepID=A0ABD5Y469_9EURY|nr:hypothetical protein [Halosimplex aquaticum]